eukprot:GHVN01031549.1.p1 GENE.GHVN01031549.1~~GHVN01031549.1.p1  ORF type:complete len:1694 (+),score=432.37 GHVN01031549.1:286-5082(+)
MAKTVKRRYEDLYIKTLPDGSTTSQLRGLRYLFSEKDMRKIFIDKYLFHITRLLQTRDPDPPCLRPPHSLQSPHPNATGADLCYQVNAVKKSAKISAGKSITSLDPIAHDVPRQYRYDYSFPRALIPASIDEMRRYTFGCATDAISAPHSTLPITNATPPAWLTSLNANKASAHIKQHDIYPTGTPRSVIHFLEYLSSEMKTSKEVLVKRVTNLTRNEYHQRLSEMLPVERLSEVMGFDTLGEVLTAIGCGGGEVMDEADWGGRKIKSLPQSQLAPPELTHPTYLPTQTLHVPYTSASNVQSTLNGTYLAPHIDSFKWRVGDDGGMVPVWSPSAINYTGSGDLTRDERQEITQLTSIGGGLQHLSSRGDDRGDVRCLTDQTVSQTDEDPLDEARYRHLLHLRVNRPLVVAALLGGTSLDRSTGGDMGDLWGACVTNVEEHFRLVAQKLERVRRSFNPDAFMTTRVHHELLKDHIEYLYLMEKSTDDGEWAPTHKANIMIDTLAHLLNVEPHTRDRLITERTGVGVSSMVKSTIASLITTQGAAAMSLNLTQTTRSSGGWVKYSPLPVGEITEYTKAINNAWRECQRRRVSPISFAHTLLDTVEGVASLARVALTGSVSVMNCEGVQRDARIYIAVWRLAKACRRFHRKIFRLSELSDDEVFERSTKAIEDPFLFVAKHAGEPEPLEYHVAVGVVAQLLESRYDSRGLVRDGAFTVEDLADFALISGLGESGLTAALMRHCKLAVQRRVLYGRGSLMKDMEAKKGIEWTQDLADRKADEGNNLTSSIGFNMGVTPLQLHRIKRSIYEEVIERYTKLPYPQWRERNLRDDVALQRGPLPTPSPSPHSPHSSSDPPRPSPDLYDEDAYSASDIPVGKSFSKRERGELLRTRACLGLKRDDVIDINTDFTWLAYEEAYREALDTQFNRYINTTNSTSPHPAVIIHPTPFDPDVRLSLHNTTDWLFLTNHPPVEGHHSSLLDWIISERSGTSSYKPTGTSKTACTGTEAVSDNEAHITALADAERVRRIEVAASAKFIKEKAAQLCTVFAVQGTPIMDAGETHYQFIDGCSQFVRFYDTHKLFTPTSLTESYRANSSPQTEPKAPDSFAHLSAASPTSSSELHLPSHVSRRDPQTPLSVRNAKSFVDGRDNTHDGDTGMPRLYPDGVFYWAAVNLRNLGLPKKVAQDMLKSALVHAVSTTSEEQKNSTLLQASKIGAFLGLNPSEVVDVTHQLGADILYRYLTNQFNSTDSRRLEKEDEVTITSLRKDFGLSEEECKEKIEGIQREHLLKLFEEDKQMNEAAENPDAKTAKELGDPLSSELFEKMRQLGAEMGVNPVEVMPLENSARCSFFRIKVESIMRAIQTSDTSPSQQVPVYSPDTVPINGLNSKVIDDVEALIYYLGLSDGYQSTLQTTINENVNFYYERIRDTCGSLSVMADLADSNTKTGDDGEEQFSYEDAPSTPLVSSVKFTSVVQDLTQMELWFDFKDLMCEGLGRQRESTNADMINSTMSRPIPFIHDDSLIQSATECSLALAGKPALSVMMKIYASLPFPSREDRVSKTNRLAHRLHLPKGVLAVGLAEAHRQNRPVRVLTKNSFRLNNGA